MMDTGEPDDVDRTAQPFSWDRNGSETRFVENMRIMRTQAGMSQSELARRAQEAGLPFHQPTIQRIEQGQRPVKLTEAIELARILGHSLDSMLSNHSLGFAHRRLATQLDSRQIDPLLASARELLHRIMTAIVEVREALVSYETVSSESVEPTHLLLKYARDLSSELLNARAQAEASVAHLAETQEKLRGIQGALPTDSEIALHDALMRRQGGPQNDPAT